MFSSTAGRAAILLAFQLALASAVGSFDRVLEDTDEVAEFPSFWECIKEHKKPFFWTVSISFVLGCLLTGVSLGIAFYSYLIGEEQERNERVKYEY